MEQLARLQPLDGFPPHGLSRLEGSRGRSRYHAGHGQLRVQRARELGSAIGGDPRFLRAIDTDQDLLHDVLRGSLPQGGFTKHAARSPVADKPRPPQEVRIRCVNSWRTFGGTVPEPLESGSGRAALTEVAP